MIDDTTAVDIQPSVLTLDETADDLFLLRDGERIARRGHPGTPKAGTWITLQRDLTVTDNLDGGIIVEEGTLH